METEVKETVDLRWAEARLEDIAKPDAKILYGIVQPGHDIPDGVPYVRPTEMDKDEILVDQIRRTTPAIAAKYKRSLLEAGDVLLSIVGTIGKVAIVPKELEGGNITQSSVRIRAGSKINGFPRLILRSPRAFAQYDAARLGTAVPRLNVAHVRDLMVPIPPLPQQRRIVSAIELQLSRLDAAVARLQAAKAKLKRYKQAVLKAAVEGELVEGLEPEDWKEVCVEDVILGAQYGSSEKSNEDPAGIPVLAMGNIRDGELIFGKLKYYPSSYAEINKFVLRDGDVLFNRTNSPELVGKSAIYRSSYPKAVFASYLIRLTVNKDICDPDWLNYYMNSPQQRHYIKTVVTQQVGQANVNGTKMKAMPLPLPGIKVQRKLVKEISTRLARANEMIITLDAELLQSTRLRQAVLKRAFEGRLV